VQLVFENKANWNIDQASVGGTEGEEHDQDAEVEENSLAHRGDNYKAAQATVTAARGAGGLSVV
jgi:hypothetical protein